jgi:hypothetical protein
MDEREVLKAQIEFLDQRLRQAETALNTSSNKDGLGERVQNLFKKEITRQRNKLSEVRADVVRNQSLVLCWTAFRMSCKECGPLFEECLTLIEGALVRRTGLDNGLCSIADALLDDLSLHAPLDWGRFTILAEKEFFGEMAAVIRLRFPEVSIWDLPIAAHEFGHFVGPVLNRPEIGGISYHPFEEELKKIADQQGRDFLHEHFADIFATFTLGPAFACTCVLLRFDPSTAFEDSPRHPAYSKRYYVIRKTLERMNLGSYKAIVTWLDSIWLRSLKAVGQRDVLAQDVTKLLDDQFEVLYDLVITELVNIQYKSIACAYSLSLLLRAPDTEVEQIVQDAFKREPEQSLADILNAAWICRIEIDDRYGRIISKIGKIAVRLCEEVIHCKSSGKGVSGA